MDFSSCSWRQRFLRDVERRNAVETDCFTELFNACMKGKDFSVIISLTRLTKSYSTTHLRYFSS